LYAQAWRSDSYASEREGEVALGLVHLRVRSSPQHKIALGDNDSYASEREAAV
jgi:hypothetical protein